MIFPPLHVVTDEAVLAGPAFGGRAREVLAAGGPRLALHLRGPRTGGAALHALALDLVPVARAAGARLLVNDRLDVARAAGADGVHLGRRSLRVEDARAVWPGAWIGASAHAADQVAASAAAGTDFVILGTIYPTPSHPERPGVGPAPIRQAAATANLPVVAIGGIDASRVDAVAAAGASGIAVLGAVWRAESAAEAVVALLEAWEMRRRGLLP